jgi:hypothetical protein
LHELTEALAAEDVSAVSKGRGETAMSWLRTSREYVAMLVPAGTK